MARLGLGLALMLQALPTVAQPIVGTHDYVVSGLERKHFESPISSASRGHGPDQIQHECNLTRCGDNANHSI
jgi:hypothetical protein